MKTQPTSPSGSPFITAVLVLAAVLALWGLFGAVKVKKQTAGGEIGSKPQVTKAESPVKPAAADDKAASLLVKEENLEDEALENLRELLDDPAAVPDEAMLRFRDAAALRRFLQSAPSWGLQVLGALPGLNSVRVGYDDLSKLNRYLQSRRNSPDSPEAEPVTWLITPPIQPVEPPKALANEGGSAPLGETYLSAINAVGDRATWGQGITVAVLDTGMQAHPTFGDAKITHMDLVQDGKKPHSHGTSVASLIAGQDERVPGVAPGATLLDIRVANEKGLSVTSVLAQGILTAVDYGAKVINISLGGYHDSQVLRDAVNYASSKGAIIVAAAGNENYDQLAYPAAFDKVISVGSVDKNQRQAWFSNSGNGLDITAPGVGLPVAWDADKMANASGTSQSAAVVSGVVATYLSWGIPATEVIRRLKVDAKPTGAPTTQVGSGVVWLQR